MRYGKETAALGQGAALGGVCGADDGIHGLNDFLPAFLSDIFAFAQEEEESAAGYTTGEVSSTILFLVQLVVMGLCFLAVYRKVGKTIDYKKTLEDW